MSNSKGLQGLTCWAASFWNLLGLRAACLKFGQSLCSRNQECHVHPTFCLACTEYRLAPYSPCMWFKTRFKIIRTPQSSLHSVPFMDITLFRDANNPGIIKPFCTALLSFASAYLGYDRYVQIHICVLACNNPLLYRSDRIKRRIFCCRKFIIIFCSSDLFVEQLLTLAECRHPFLIKFRQILLGNNAQYFFEQEFFCSSFYSDYPPFRF